MFDVGAAALPDAVPKTVIVRHRSPSGARGSAAVPYMSKTVGREYPVVDEPPFKAKPWAGWLPFTFAVS
jgi:hypothetical protein